MTDVQCPYCDGPAELVFGRAVYASRPDLWGRQFYLCRPCNAYVGVHEGTDRPYGSLANAELRRERSLAHKAFDRLWTGRDKVARQEAYAWLAAVLRLSPSDCHIGNFDVATCRQVVAACEVQTTAAYSPRQIAAAVPQCPRCRSTAYAAETDVIGGRLHLLGLRCAGCDADILAAYRDLKR